MPTHQTVLLAEAVDALVTEADGLYVDGTFGRGGHSREILTRLSDSGRLLGIDKDPRAIASAVELAGEDSRFAWAQQSFAELPAVLAERYPSSSGCQGILLDLGVSSPQLDEAERGFSFLNDGPLDMRMNPDVGMSAAEWVAVAAEQEIITVLRDLGEERFARRMASAILEERARAPITRTVQLANIIAEANPAWEKGKHPATRAFQAIRIHINNELGDLRNLLDAAIGSLAIGGRLVVISFHSLEDRMVKRFIKEASSEKKLPRSVPIRAGEFMPPLKALSRAIKPSADEVAGNPRSRSAVMRIAERLR
jgi:16S rRNA (cytosine1402-N4)-methyltransferase